MKNRRSLIIILSFMCAAAFGLSACNLIDKIKGKDSAPVAEEVDLSEFEDFDVDPSEFDEDFEDTDEDGSQQDDTAYYDETMEEDEPPMREEPPQRDEPDEDSWESISDEPSPRDNKEGGSDDGAQDHYGPAAAARDKKNGSGGGGASEVDSGEYNGPGDEGNGKDNSYIIAGSDKEILDKKSLKKLSDEDLRLAINEIYARHGRKFKSAELQEYFNSKSWYKPQYDPDEFDKKQTDILSNVELKNLQTLTAIRSERGN